MTREPQAMTKTLPFRVNGNSLFFNNSVKNEESDMLTTLAAASWFAQAQPAPQSIQHVAIAEHRPASRPGAD